MPCDRLNRSVRMMLICFAHLRLRKGSVTLLLVGGEGGAEFARHCHHIIP